MSILPSQFQKIFAAVDDSILGYDFRKSENLKPLEGHGGTIVSLSIADGLMFSATDNGSVRIWDLSSHECIKKFHIEPHIKAIKVDSDRRILVVVYKDNAVAWDCPTGKVLDKIIVSQHIPSMIAIGCDTIVSGSDEKSISIQKIAGYTFSVIIKNELNERIENFQLLDYEMHSCAKPFSCDPHEHKQVSISSIDSFRDWFISFTCNGEIVTTQIDQPLVPLREIMLTYNLRDGTILASIEPWVAKRFLKLFYQTKFPASSDKDDLEFPILTVGKPIKKITLIDKNGGQVDAVKDDKLQDKWNILKSHRYAPYRLCIETEDDKKYEWKIPFLFDHIEGVLSLPKEPQPVKARSLTSSFSKIPTVQPGRMRSMSTPAIYITGERVYLNVSKKPIFSLYEEASAQEFRVSGCLQCQAEVEDLHMIRYIEV